MCTLMLIYVFCYLFIQVLDIHKIMPLFYKIHWLLFFTNNTVSKHLWVSTYVI